MSVLFSLLRWLFHKLPLSAVQKHKLAHWFYRRFRFLRELQKREVVQNIYSPEMVGGLTEGLFGMEEGVIHEPCRVANGVWEWTAYEEVQRDIARQRGKKTRKDTSAALSIFEMGGKSPGGFAKSIHLPVPPSQPEVSIIVPVYNHISLTLECLRSIAEHTGGGVSYEVLVADDASTDSSAAVLAGIPNLTLIRNVSNLGFLRNCNRALQHVRGKYVLFLNNDVQVAPGWLSSLYSTFLQYPKVGAVGPKFIYPNGFLQEAGAAFRYDAMSDMIGLNDDGSYRVGAQPGGLLGGIPAVLL